MQGVQILRNEAYLLYVAMAKDEAQRRRWTFYEAVNIGNPYDNYQRSTQKPSISLDGYFSGMIVVEGTDSSLLNNTHTFPNDTNDICALKVA